MTTSSPAAAPAPAWQVSQRAAVLLLIVTVLAWGLGWPVNKVILQSLPPLWTVAIRSAIATAALFVLAFASGRLALPRRADLAVLCSIALLHMVGYSLLVAWGLQLVPTGRSVVLAYTTPIWLAPGGHLLLGERLTARRALGVVFGLAGLAVLFNPLAFDWADQRAALGNLALLTAALLWAASILHIRRHHWTSSQFELVPWEMLLATIVTMVIAIVFAPPLQVEWTGGLALLLLYAAIPGTALTYWSSASASRGLPAVTMSLGLLGVPLVSILTAALWLGETPTIPLLAAVALIIGGVAVGTLGGGKS